MTDAFLADLDDLSDGGSEEGPKIEEAKDEEVCTLPVLHHCVRARRVRGNSIYGRVQSQSAAGTPVVHTETNAAVSVLCVG